mgnify:FL=1
MDKRNRNCKVVLRRIEKFDKYEQLWYYECAMKRKSNINSYTSESGIVETDYKVFVKEHL